MKIKSWYFGEKFSFGGRGSRFLFYYLGSLKKVMNHIDSVFFFESKRSTDRFDILCILSYIFEGYIFFLVQKLQMYYAEVRRNRK
jgi:hypothetical protein